MKETVKAKATWCLYKLGSCSEFDDCCGVSLKYLSVLQSNEILSFANK